MQLTKGAIGNLINRYKAVLKKCHLMNTFGSLAVAGMLIMGGAGMAVAQDVALEGKNNYDGKEVNHLMGGWLVNNAETAKEAHGDIILTVKGDKISEIIGGSYAKSLTATEDSKLLTVKHGDITTTINGDKTTSTEFVVGGSKVAGGAGANLKTGNISLTITGGTFGKEGKTNDYELVMGGNYLKASTGDVSVNNTATAENITVNISGGKFDTSVTGGSVAHVYGSGDKKQVLSVTDASTSVTITDGTFEQSSSTGQGAIELDPSIIGGGLALVTAQQGTATSTITGNTLVTINGKNVDITDKVLGGSLAQGKGATVTIGTEDSTSTSAVVVENVNSVGDLVGGNMTEDDRTMGAKDVTATLHGNSSVTVKAGKVEGDIIGGSYARNAGTVTTNGNTSVVFNAANSATVSQAEYIVGGDKVLSNGTATGEITGTSSVTINNDASVTTGAVVGGSFSRAAPGTAEATVDSSKVTINGGKSIAGVVGGGLAENLTGAKATSDVTNTSAVSIKGGTVTNIVYTTSSGKKASSYAAVAGAGFATGKDAAASVGNSVVVIDGTETAIQGNQPEGGEKDYFDKDNAKVVAGGVAVNGGTVKVTNTSLTMKDGKVTGDLVGGNLIDGTGNAGDITSTNVALTGGTLDGEVMGGSYVRGSNTSNIDTTNVLVSGGTLKSVGNKAQYVLGGGKALVFAKDQNANLKITTTNVTISDAVKVLGGGVIGGSLAKGTDTGNATVNVTKANTTILGGTQIAGVVGGGVAENYGAATGEVSSSVTESQLTISGGTIDALRYGALISKDDAKGDAAVVGGGVASAKGTGTITSSVTTANTTINGGTINGNVFAGGMADGTSATANVTNANLTISGNADIQGNIHAGGYALNGGTATVTDTATVTFDGNSSFAGKVFGQGHDATSSNKATVNNSTLAFTNYTGEFNGQVVGFTKLDVAEGSTLKLQTLSTGTTAGKEAGVFNNKALTLAGAGNVEAEAVNVVADKGLSVKNGTLTVTNSLKSTEDGNGTKGINVSDNGVLSAANRLLVKKDGESISTADGLKKLYLGQGGTLAVTGLSSISTADMQTYRSKLVAANSTGLIKYEGADITISDDDQAATPGNLKGSVAEKTGALLTGTTVEYGGASLTDTTTINGNYGAETVLISNAADAPHTVELTGDLTLLGDGKDLITVKGEGTPTLSTVNVSDGKALNLGSAAAPSQGGTLGEAHIVLGNDSSLNAVAGEYTVGDVTGTAGKVTANTGANLNTGKIEAQAVTADAANINATGDVTAGGITLVKGGSVTSGKNITVTASPITNADGTLQAGGSITATDKDLTQAAGGKLTLRAQQGTIVAANISATNVTAKKLTASGDVAVDGGTLDLTGTDTATAEASEVKNLTLTNGTQASIAGSLTLQDHTGTITVGSESDTVGGTTLSAQHIDLKGGTLLVDPAWGLASSNVAVASMGSPAPTTPDVIVSVSGRVGVGQNSYLALGTADTGWLPGVVAGYTNGVGLSQTGITAALGVFKGIEIAAGNALVVDGRLMDTAPATGDLTDAVNHAAVNSATFGANSLLVVNGEEIYGNKAAISFENKGDLKVDAGAKLLVTDAVAGQTYTIVGNVNDPTTDLAGWKNNGMTSTTDMISLGNAVFDDPNNKVTTSAVRNDAHTVFPNLSDGMANAVNDLYTGHAGAAGQPNWDYADVNSADMGVRFLSRATDNRFLGMDKEAAAATIESAARIAFAGAAPQMTKMASDAGTNAVVNRLGFANPVDGAQAMDAEGKIVDRNTTGFALWIAPLWQSQHGWGLDAGNMDYGFNGNLGGVSLGADYTFENAIRAGITFNIGGGYAESSGGDLSSTENRMNFWGLGAYAGWNYENFGVMADVSYTSTWNDLKQDVDSRMGMGDLEADVQATAISAGLRAEYLLQTSAMDIIPHIGVRYMSLNTWGYDVDTHGGTVLEGDSLHQDIWTFPIGVTFSKDFALDSGWSFKPSLDFTVIPAAGDIKAKHDVHFTGLPGTYEVETQMMDYLTWQGGVGLELANDNMSIGVNYTLQAGQHTTGHGVFGSFRYEF